MKQLLDLDVIREEAEIVMNSDLQNVQKVRRMIKLQEEALRVAYIGNEEKKYEALNLYNKINTNWNFLMVLNMSESEKDVAYRYIRNYEYA